MVFILIGVVIVFGVFLYFEHKKTKELINELKLSQSIRDSLLKSETKEHTEVANEEQKEKEEKIKKAFKNLMDYDENIALGKKEE